RVGVAPDHPPDPRVDEAVLVARGVDRLHPVEAEVPLEVGVDERGHEPPGRGVDVQRHVGPAPGGPGVEGGGDLPHRLCGGPSAPPPAARASRVAEISATGSYEPSNVDPSTATTPMVFSSQAAAAGPAVRWKVLPSMGTRRGSTSQ